MAGYFSLASIKSLASLRCLRLLNNTYILFWSSVDYISTIVILWYYIQRLKYIYLYASAVHLYIVVWLYCCQLRHGNPPPGPPVTRGNSGCDRLVSEPTLSELNTSLLCLISVHKLHILRVPSLDIEHRTNSVLFYFDPLWIIISTMVIHWYYT